MPQRQAQLHTWLVEACAFAECTLTPVSGDASFRRYFRVERPGAEPLIAMDAPPDKENSAPFLDVTERLLKAGVHAPKVFQADLEQGFLLLEDLGDDLYQPALDAQSVDRLYAEAIDALLRIQRHGDSQGLPQYDEALLRREMTLFPEWLLERHLGIRLEASAQAELQKVYDLLVEQALAQPRVLVHRDYHSRNLLLCEPDNPGIIDYQDAVYGPISYDLVSLLRDCYVSWPRAQVAGWRDHYVAKAQAAGLLGEADSAQFTRWFDMMGVQRHLKAAGIFARLWHRDGKPGYLADIPRTLGYIEALADEYPALHPLTDLITARVLPALAELEV